MGNNWLLKILYTICIISEKFLKLNLPMEKMMLVLSVPRNGLEQEIGETLAAFVLRR